MLHPTAGAPSSVPQRSYRHICQHKRMDSIFLIMSIYDSIGGIASTKGLSEYWIIAVPPVDASIRFP